ncbi:MAG: hypothetical protein Harvfovirus9_10 [Harvfovirus sp.]|uniref:Uncharacterized protein n=1 Tax=Harvfovirus sp. TaxID=2487768 RepID=A0A3G5A164_9VIRU|nr:MAG: hypothetical protein Harvfovirus9_10 [Harvfovirus sp.]
MSSFAIPPDTTVPTPGLTSKQRWLYAGFGGLVGIAVGIGLTLAVIGHLLQQGRRH